MATYYVETYRAQTGRSPLPGRGNADKLDFAVYSESKFSRDVLHPGMMAVYRVDCVRNSTEAVCCILEHAAGFRPCVRLIMGGKLQSSESGQHGPMCPAPKAVSECDCDGTTQLQ